MGVEIPWGNSQGGIPKEFSERVEEKGGYWFIPKFLRWQYGEKLNKGDAFSSAFEMIESKGFLESLRRVYRESPDSPGRAMAIAISSSSLVSNTFAKPTIEDLAAYCKERGNGVDVEKFLNHYDSNGWKVGRNPMKDWKAAVRTWERSPFGSSSVENGGKPRKREVIG